MYHVIILRKERMHCMAQIFQAYSLLWIAGALVILVGLLLFRNKPRPADALAFLGLLVGLVAIYFYVRPTQTLMGEAASVQQMIGAGKPVLLEFQSPY
jgi:hypothetical protein